MFVEIKSPIKEDKHVLQSFHLDREVVVDCYYPSDVFMENGVSLLLINDGQDLATMGFGQILDDLVKRQEIKPLMCVGIHCASDRLNEYGTAQILDYAGRGAKAFLYSRFVLEELIPYIRQSYGVHSFLEKAFAGFSLGGLAAMDMVWNNPREFSKIGVFSGSFWWRDTDQKDAHFDEDIHRIMHRQVRAGDYHPWLKFFFEVGAKDETADRNKNGIIDSIDDTLALMWELEKKGYDRQKDIHYLELQEGRHDLPTWALAFPDFLKWGWGI